MALAFPVSVPVGTDPESSFQTLGLTWKGAGSVMRWPSAVAG